MVRFSSAGLRWLMCVGLSCMCMCVYTSCCPVVFVGSFKGDRARLVPGMCVCVCVCVNVEIMC